MEAFYLIKIGEILLKLGNRREFEDRLRGQLHERLSRAAIPHKIEMYPGRYFVTGARRESAGGRADPLAHAWGQRLRAGDQGRRRRSRPCSRPRSRWREAEPPRGKTRFKAESRAPTRASPSAPSSSRPGSATPSSRPVPEPKVDLHRPEFTDQRRDPREGLRLRRPGAAACAVCPSVRAARAFCCSPGASTRR